MWCSFKQKLKVLCFFKKATFYRKPPNTFQFGHTFFAQRWAITVISSSVENKENESNAYFGFVWNIYCVNGAAQCRQID